MSIETKSVTGRRTIRYSSYDELLKDAERIAADPDTKTLGNWSTGQIFQHLAGAIESSIDGSGFKLPWPMRVIFTLLMKKKYLQGALPAGFKAPSKFQPAHIPTDQAVVNLRKAVDRMNSETTRVMHPAFGNITHEEWDQFNLRHCELHMSFTVESRA